MESILKTINRVKSANYHLTSSCQILQNMTFSTQRIQKALPVNLTLSVACFPSSRAAASKNTSKLLIATHIFPFQNLSSHYALGHQVVQPCTGKEYINTYNS